MRVWKRGEILGGVKVPSVDLTGDAPAQPFSTETDNRRLPRELAVERLRFRPDDREAL
jgi:hypothetical protein